MNRTFYISTSLDKKDSPDVRKIECVLKDLGFSWSFDWTRFEGTPVIEDCLMGSVSADVFVFLPTEKSQRTAHGELGARLLMNSFVYILEADKDCLLYNHPLAVKCESVDEMIELIKLSYTSGDPFVSAPA